MAKENTGKTPCATCREAAVTGPGHPPGDGSPDALPKEVRDFVDDHLHAVEQLEVLLLLYRDRPRRWRAETITLALGSSRESIARRLGDLVGHGLAERVADGYAWRPEAERDRVVALLDATYRTRRVSLIAYLVNQS